MEEYTISIIGKDSCELEPKGKAETHFSYRNLPINTLQANLTDFITRLGTSFENIKTEMSNYALDEIEINVEVSASGGISLVGSIEAGATGGIMLRFKRCLHE